MLIADAICTRSGSVGSAAFYRGRVISKLPGESFNPGRGNLCGSRARWDRGVETWARCGHLKDCAAWWGAVTWLSSFAFYQVIPLDCLFPCYLGRGFHHRSDRRTGGRQRGDGNEMAQPDWPRSSFWCSFPHHLSIPEHIAKSTLIWPSPITLWYQPEKDHCPHRIFFTEITV